MHSDPHANNVWVTLPCQALSQVFDECDHYDSAETGGRIVGRYRPAENNEGLVVEVQGLIESGPGAERSATSFFQDGAYQADVFRRLERAHPDIEHLGNWHTHHVNGYPTLSGGDRETYRRIVNHRLHNLDFFYALLVVRRKAKGAGLERYAVRHFLLRRGDAATYEIPPRNIAMVDQPLVRPPAISDGVPLGRQPNLAEEQRLINASFPNMKPYLSGQKVVWKGPVELAGGGAVTLNVIPHEGSHRVLVRTQTAKLPAAAPVWWAVRWLCRDTQATELHAVAQELAEQSFDSAHAAIISAQRRIIQRACASPWMRCARRLWRFARRL